VTGSTPNESHTCSKANHCFHTPKEANPSIACYQATGSKPNPSHPGWHFRRYYKPSFYLIPSNLFPSVILLLNSAPCSKATPLLHFLHPLLSSQISVLLCLHVYPSVFHMTPALYIALTIVIMIIDLNPVIHTPSIWPGLLCSSIDLERLLSFQPSVDLYTNMDACSYDPVSLHTIWT